MEKIESNLKENVKLKEELKKARNRTKPALFILGIVCIILIFSLALIGIFYDKTIPDIVFWCLTIMALLFVSSSVFGRKIFERITMHLPGK